MNEDVDIRHPEKFGNDRKRRPFEAAHQVPRMNRQRNAGIRGRWPELRR